MIWQTTIEQKSLQIPNLPLTDSENLALSVWSMSGTLMTSSEMVCNCFVFNFDVAFEISTTFSPFGPNLTVTGREDSDLQV